jgi:hypothetical protein
MKTTSSFLLKMKQTAKKHMAVEGISICQNQILRTVRLKLISINVTTHGAPNSDGFNCPIPPRENNLPFEVKAGEKNYKGYTAVGH